MKKIQICVLVMLATIGTSFAQGQRGSHEKKMNPEEMAEKKAEKMKEHLNLSEEQYTKILALNLKEAESRKDHQEARKEEMDERKTANKERKAVHLENLKEILTEEQYVTFLEKQLENESKGRRKHGMKGERKGAREKKE